MGREFSLEAAAAIEKGMSRDEVLVALGEPMVRQVSGEVEHWYFYSFEAERACDVYLLGLRLKKAPATTEEAEITFSRGAVSATQVRSYDQSREPRYHLPEADGSPSNTSLERTTGLRPVAAQLMSR